MHRKASLAGYFAVQKWSHFCRWVLRPCPELPNTTLTAARLEGSQGHPGKPGQPCKSLPSCFGQALASPSFAIFYQYLSLQRPKHSQSAALSTFLGGCFASGLSGLAHSRFPWGIISQLAPHKAHLVSRRGCDLPKDCQELAVMDHRAHTSCLPCVWGAWPEPSLVSAVADLHQHLSISPSLPPCCCPAQPR